MKTNNGIERWFSLMHPAQPDGIFITLIQFIHKVNLIIIQVPIRRASGFAGAMADKFSRGGPGLHIKLRRARKVALFRQERSTSPSA